MITFTQFLENQGQLQGINGAFQGMVSGIGEQAAKKVEEYAKRIINGEDPNQVMQGIKLNGATWNLVMQKVQELKAQGNQQGKVSLSDFASKITDIKWHQVYDAFARRYRMNPTDPNVGQIGQSLYQAAMTNDMSLIKNL